MTSDALDTDLSEVFFEIDGLDQATSISASSKDEGFRYKTKAKAPLGTKSGNRSSWYVDSELDGNRGTKISGAYTNDLRRA